MCVEGVVSFDLIQLLFVGSFFSFVFVVQAAQMDDDTAMENLEEVIWLFVLQKTDLHMHSSHALHF